MYFVSAILPFCLLMPLSPSGFSVSGKEQLQNHLKRCQCGAQKEGCNGVCENRRVGETTDDGVKALLLFFGPCKWYVRLALLFLGLKPVASFNSDIGYCTGIVTGLAASQLHELMCQAYLE